MYGTGESIYEAYQYMHMHTTMHVRESRLRALHGNWNQHSCSLAAPIAVSMRCILVSAAMHMHAHQTMYVPAAATTLTEFREFHTVADSHGC